MNNNIQGKVIVITGASSGLREAAARHLFGTYNPHFHLIVLDKETASILINEWLNIGTPKFAGRTSQNMQPVANCEATLIEIVKYGSKIFTEPDQGC